MSKRIRPAKIFGIAFTAIGVPFLAVAVILFTAGFYAGTADAPVLKIVGGTFMPIGAIFAAIGIAGLTVAYVQKNRENRLVQNGECYDAEIVRIYENGYMRVNGRHPLIVECVYIDRMGKSCLVKSGSLWLDSVNKEITKARVWVNLRNPRDYFVEAYSGEEANIKYDYDYR